MARYEYRILHMPTTSISVLNERINTDAKEGWEPILLSGNEYVNIVMRRPARHEEGEGERET